MFFFKTYRHRASRNYKRCCKQHMNIFTRYHDLCSAASGRGWISKICPWPCSKHVSGKGWPRSNLSDFCSSSETGIFMAFGPGVVQSTSRIFWPWRRRCCPWKWGARRLVTFGSESWASQEFDAWPKHIWRWFWWHVVPDYWVSYSNM